MYLRAKKRIKDGKEHRYWSIASSTSRMPGCTDGSVSAVARVVRAPAKMCRWVGASRELDGDKVRYHRRDVRGMFDEEEVKCHKHAPQGR